MTRLAFITVTDAPFFPGTLATVNSICEFHPDADIYVISNQQEPLTPPQLACLEGVPHVQVVDSNILDTPGRHIEALELKAYACHDLCDGYDVICGIDSDCLLCSNVSDVVERCRETGGFLGGRDVLELFYGPEYRVYGIDAPARNPANLSTAIYFSAVTPRNKDVMARWVECCSQARFNRCGPYPGPNEMGVLNAVLFAMRRTADIELLENRLWSQSHTYWDSTIDFRDGRFFNITALGRQQRSFHVGGPPKFWLRSHRDFVLDGHEPQMYPYIWFLAMFWFGRCGDWDADPFLYLPDHSRHLVDDLVNCLPQILQVYPPARSRWDALTKPIINRALAGIPRALVLGGSMTEVIDLVAARPDIRRYVEVGGYEGGSLLTLGLRFANRDIDFYSIESFTGSLGGSMDGHPLPSRRRFIEHLSRYPGLRARLVPGESSLAAALFDDASLDFVFIDACHETLAVLSDIDRWLPKIRAGGIIAGDDYRWDSVRDAVNTRFQPVNVKPSGDVWWIEVP